MTPLKLAFCSLALSMTAQASLAQGDIPIPYSEAPIIFAALVGPGALEYTDRSVSAFNFATPNGNVDLSRPNSAALASPGTPPVFFLAPPGSIGSVGAGQGLDDMLDSSAGLLD